MKKWVAWRPLGEHDVRIVQQALKAPVREWSEAWFGGVPLFECTRAEATAVSRDLRACGLLRWRLGESLELTASLPALRACAAAALRGPAGLTHDFGPGVGVIDAFQRRFLYDLARRVAAALLPESGAQAGPAGLRRADAVPRFARRIVAELSAGDRATSISIVVDAHALPQPLDRPRAARLPQVSGRIGALAASRVRVAASIGTATISARELLALEPGDVVMTDRRIDQSVSVRVGASEVLPAGAYPCRVGDRVSVQFSDEHS